MSRPKAWIAWSSGKDSAWALHVAREQAEVDVVGMLTTLNEAHGRVSIHGVRETLLRAQAAAVGLPLHVTPLPSPCPNDAYERAMREAMDVAQAQGVTHMVFGDLFLEDVRAYRVQNLARANMTGYFPLWQRDTAELAQEMLAHGVVAYLTCVDPRHLSAEFAGRAYDATLLADLPTAVDPCGENGEFHTLATAGPAFREPLDVRMGDVVERDGFVYADVLPAAAAE